jgi:hypothetical protein
MSPHEGEPTEVTSRKTTFDIATGFHGTNMKALDGMLAEGTRAGHLGAYGPGHYVAHNEVEEPGEDHTWSRNIGEKMALAYASDRRGSGAVAVKGETNIKNPKIIRTWDEWKEGHDDYVRKNDLPEGSDTHRSYNEYIASQGYDAIHDSFAGTSVMLQPAQFNPTHMKEKDAYALSPATWDNLR